MNRQDITPEQEAAERSKTSGRTKLVRLIGLILVLFVWLGLAGVGGPLVFERSAASCSGVMS